MSDFPMFTYLVPDPSNASLLDFSGCCTVERVATGLFLMVPLTLIFRCQALASSEYAEHIQKTKQHLWTHCSLSPFCL